MQAQGPFLGCCGGFFFISKRALLDYPTLIYSCTASTVRYVSLGTPQPAAAAQVGCVAPASQRPQRLPHSLAAVNGSRPPLDSADVVTVTQLYRHTRTVYHLHGRTIMASSEPAACRCRCARGPMSQSPAANHRSAAPSTTGCLHFSPSSSPAT
jgi:hypothetical protein